MEMVESRDSIDTVFSEWKAGRSAESLAIVQRLAQESDWRSRLLAFQVSEREYAEWTDDERSAKSEAIFERATALRAIGRSLMDAAQGAASVDPAQARRLLETAKKLGDANRGSEIVQYGRMAGEAVYLRASQRLELVDSAAASPVR